MNKQFEHMQKLAFGKVTKPQSLTESSLRDKIKELVNASLDEAKKKKKSADVAPQDADIELDTPNNEAPPAEAPPAEDTTAASPPVDTVAPEPASDINPTVKSIQDALQKAYAQAKTLGDEKLVTQIGNTITMLVRNQVLGGAQQNAGM